MKNLVVSLFILLLLFFVSSVFTSCSDSVEPIAENLPYMSLKIGDERQIVFANDSSTIFYRVNDSANRSDGMIVFSYAWYYGTDTTPNISYYGIKDGFFIATELDTVKDSSNFIPSNPFREQRLAKLFPSNGDTWQSIVGDSLSGYFIASDIGAHQTFASTFNNCFSYKFCDFLSVIYSKGIGHIASIYLPDSSAYLSSYIKVNNKIYGSKMPPKDPFFPGAAKNKNSKEILSFLLGKQ